MKQNREIKQKQTGKEMCVCVCVCVCARVYRFVCVCVFISFHLNNWTGSTANFPVTNLGSRPDSAQMQYYKTNNTQREFGFY